MSDCCMSDTPNVSVKNCFAIDVLKSLKGDIQKVTFQKAVMSADGDRILGCRDKLPKELLLEVIGLIDIKIDELGG